MARVKSVDRNKSFELRSKLRDDVEAGLISWGEGVRRMRECLGMSQARFGQAFKINRRLIIDMESGKANPTVETLMKLAKPFGFQVGFIVKTPVSVAMRTGIQDDKRSE